MTVVRVVPKDEWAVLEKYFSQGTGVVLIPESDLERFFPQAMAEAVKSKDKTEYDYDFGGGDPDFYVDIATTSSHYAIQSLLEDEVADDD